MDYKDFVLQLDRAAAQSGFVTRVLRSPAGEAEAPFVNPLSQADLDKLWQIAYRARQAGRASSDCPERLEEPLTEILLEEIGDRLFHALFRGPVRSCWVRSFSEATQHSGGGLRLKLQLNLADPLIANLVELPWEFLFSPEHGGFLGLQRKTPILRHMRLPLPGSRPLPARPIRVLTVLSQPAAMAELSLEEEAGKIAAALRALPGVEVLPLHNPTIETLRENLLRQDFQILHFMGHGGFDERSGQGVLCFTGDRGVSVPVSGSMLATHL
ncbi:MAG TPA: CHAT domain-containing protein, partial [Thermoanaerobaculia bacterium]|nr:CHAT domain-containing protein [Thermoanaerobaculia bacterium]